MLFLQATVISGKPVLPTAHHSDVYLTALGAILTLVYMAGLIFRPQRQFLRMGIDSVVVAALYALGVAGLATING